MSSQSRKCKTRSVYQSKIYTRPENREDPTICSLIVQSARSVREIFVIVVWTYEFTPSPIEKQSRTLRAVQRTRSLLLEGRLEEKDTKTSVQWKQRILSPAQKGETLRTIIEVYRTAYAYKKITQKVVQLRFKENSGSVYKISQLTASKQCWHTSTKIKKITPKSQIKILPVSSKRLRRFVSGKIDLIVYVYGESGLRK